MPVESVMSTNCGWLARTPVALLSASAFWRSAGGRGVGVPICPIAPIFRQRMKSTMHDRRNAADGIFDAPAMPREPILLFFLLVRTNFPGLNLQFFVQCAQLLFHLLEFLVEFHLALRIVHAPHLPVERRQAIVRGGVGG